MIESGEVTELEGTMRRIMIMVDHHCIHRRYIRGLGGIEVSMVESGEVTELEGTMRRIMLTRLR